eukprot:SAG11_NODE_812_length_7059_cov_5.203017_2_plen_148_part_00
MLTMPCSFCFRLRLNGNNRVFKAWWSLCLFRAQDASAPQHVLVPTHTGNDRLRWSRENRRAGAGEEGSTVVRLDQQNWAELERQGAFGNAEEEGSYDRKEWELATHGLPNDGCASHPEFNGSPASMCDAITATDTKLRAIGMTTLNT